MRWMLETFCGRWFCCDGRLVIGGLASVILKDFDDGGCEFTVLISASIESMAVELLELKFRLYDGTDIGPNKYVLTTTVASLKESVLSQWPKEKEHKPKTINDLKLINAGKILENSKTLAESRVPAGEIPGGVVTMHVVVRPPSSDKGTEKHAPDKPEITECRCTIL